MPFIDRFVESAAARQDQTVKLASRCLSGNLMKLKESLKNFIKPLSDVPHVFAHPALLRARRPISSEDGPLNLWLENSSDSLFLRVSPQEAR